MRDLFIDFETYSEAPLTGVKTVGSWAYSMHPSTECLMMAWAFDNDDPQIWLPGDPHPAWVKDLEAAGICGAEVDFRITAWNDFFELSIFANVLNWPVGTPSMWCDTAGRAAALALPRGLAECGEALGMNVDSVKDPEGKKLVSWFCSPYKSKGKLIRRMPADYPEKFEALKKYCVQDVIALRAIHRKLRPLSPIEQKLWELDRKMNLRGVAFDMQAVKDAIAIREKTREKLLKEVKHTTGGMLVNINSSDQLQALFAEQFGITLESTQKEYLKTVLDSTDMPEIARRVLEIRLSIAKASLAKYDKLLDIAPLGEACGLLRYHGAATGRWSGNLFQPQNLPRPDFGDTDLCIEFFCKRDPEEIELLYGDPLDALSSCIRGMIKAREGHRLIVGDFSQIESRVLAWLAGDTEKLKAYEGGDDIYKRNAAAAFKVPYSTITKYQRTIGKVIELACGYQGSVGAFHQFAAIYGLTIGDSEAKALIQAWRAGNPRVVSYWYAINAAAIAAVDNPGEEYSHRNVAFKVQGGFLFCRLPSGGLLAYHRPHLKSGLYGAQVGFWGVNPITKKYGEQETYGGKLVGNITQAVARGLMADRMLALDAAGYPLLLTVHDEIIAEAPYGFGSLDDFNKIMQGVPAWAIGIPLAVEGFESERYKK